MRILIAGATGAIGRPSIRRLRANRHEVFALTRSPDALREIGAEAVIVDALDAAAVKAAVGRILYPRHYDQDDGASPPGRGNGDDAGLG